MTDLFKPPSNNGKCREAIYAEVKAAAGEIVFVRDLELKFAGVFRSVTIYQAAKDLAENRLVRRYDTLRDGKLCIALVRVDPWAGYSVNKERSGTYTPETRK
jgi:hypothetical protein